jgi:hypothetical protein
MGFFKNMFKKKEKFDFHKVPDNELIEAVVNWIYSLISKNDNEFDTVMKMSEPIKFFYATNAVFNEMMNGGFNQLIFNSGKVWIIAAFEGFQAIGLPEIASQMVKGVEILDANMDKLSPYLDGTIESFSKSYELKLFDEIDEAFSNNQQEIELKTIQYIRNHIDFFGRKKQTMY